MYFFFKMGASTIVEWRKELGERFGESYKNVPFSRFFEKTETTAKSNLSITNYHLNLIFFEISF